MYEFLIIFVFITLSFTTVNCGYQTDTNNFTNKLQQKHLQQAAEILKNITEPQTLYEISLELLNHKESLIKLMFLEKIYFSNYKWYQALDIQQSLKLQQAIEGDKELILYAKMKDMLNNIEFNIISKASVELKNCLILKNLDKFNNLTNELSSLPLTILGRCIKLSLSSTYGLILHSKLLKRLNLFINLNRAKLVYFIELFKELQNQNALSINLIYKLTLSLRYILSHYNFENDRILNLALINIKQSLPKYIRLLIFSTNICIVPLNTNSYLSCQTDTTFRLSSDLNDDSSLWLTYIFEQKIILESKTTAVEIFVNYNHNLNDNFNNYHLKPITIESYKLQNSLTNQMLCLRNSVIVWQNASQLNTNNNNNTNCLWSINNCTSLKRFLINEYY